MLTCIAIDDEPLALELLKKYIEKIYFLECKGFVIYGNTGEHQD